MNSAEPMPSEMRLSKYIFALAAPRIAANATVGVNNETH